MADFFERFAGLCRREGLAPNAAARELGIPSGSVTAWKRGSVPRSATLEAIAARFGVTVDWLLGRDDPPPGLDQFLLAMGEEARDLTPQDRELLLAMARRLAQAGEEQGG